MGLFHEQQNLPIKPKADHTEIRIDLENLKNKSVRGGAITIASQGVSIAIQLTSTAVLARILTPEDYGIMAMVLAVTAFAGLFRDLGLSSAAIQKQALTHGQQSNLFWLNTAIGTLLTLLVIFVSPLVAWFYAKPELVRATIALSFTIVISSAATQHGASLAKEMQFGRQAVATVTGAFAGLTVSIALALSGLSYWALVWGSIMNAITTTVLLWALSPFRPGLPSKGSDILDMVIFGANISAFNFVNYFQRNLDNILIGRFWGPGPLGLYSRAYSLLLFPITSIQGPINTVAFPAMSKLQDEPEALRRYYLKTTSLIALLSMPLTAFFFVASRPIIELVLGPQWSGIAPIFSCLALAAFIQPTTGFVGSLLLSLGQGRRYLSCGLFNAVVLSICFIIGVRWGPIGVAIAYALGNYLLLYPYLSWAFRESPVSFSMFAKACAFPAIVSLFGTTGALLSNSYIHLPNPLFQLCLLFTAFAATAIPLIFITNAGRTYMKTLSGMIEHFRKATGGMDKIGSDPIG